MPDACGISPEGLCVASILTSVVRPSPPVVGDSGRDVKLTGNQKKKLFVNVLDTSAASAGPARTTS